MKTVMPYCYSSDKSRMEEVAPDIFRLDMPMPQAIGSTNSYLIKLRVAVVKEMSQQIAP